jgi:elongation factor P
MLEYNEITLKKYIIVDDEPYEVIGSHVFRKQQRKPVNQVKLRNLITGRIMERSFHQSEKADEADIDSKTIKYLYSSKNEHWFADAKDASDRFKLPEAMVGSSIKFIKANSELAAMVFDDDIIGIKLPIKVELKVTEAPPAVKGNTAQGAMKVAKLETGAEVSVPLFINEGDSIRVNTDTGEYVERA